MNRQKFMKGMALGLACAGLPVIPGFILPRPRESAYAGPGIITYREIHQRRMNRVMGEIIDKMICTGTQFWKIKWSINSNE